MGDGCTQSNTSSHLWRMGTVICHCLSVSVVFRYNAVMIQCNCRPLQCCRLIFLNLWKRHIDRGIHCLIYQDISLTECLSSIWKASLYQTQVWITLFIISGLSHKCCMNGTHTSSVGKEVGSAVRNSVVVLLKKLSVRMVIFLFQSPSEATLLYHSDVLCFCVFEWNENSFHLLL